MNKYSTLVSNLKRGILRFSEKISDGLTRPEFKFISQMIYGLLASQSCHLSKIGRALDEKISLKKTIDRLSRNLNEFTGGARLLHNYVCKVKKLFCDRTILIFDDSDITKPQSPKMEGIGTVRDGSTGQLGQGYHTLAVAALSPKRKQPIGIYTRVYSASEKDFVSADEETLKALRYVGKHFKKKHIRAFDRGYDNNLYYNYLVDNNEKFVIRAKKNRNVFHKGKTINILTLANKYKGKFSLRFKRKNGKLADCKVSIVPIMLPTRPNEQLNLVICRGIGNDPLMLITNLQSNDSHLALTITKVYLMRWRIEEYYGFKKQQFDFEDFRVRSLNSIRNLDLLLTIAIGYIGMISENPNDRATAIELVAISKRIYKAPKFLFYAIADGLFTVFSRCKQGINNLLKKREKSKQLRFFPESAFGWC